VKTRIIWHLGVDALGVPGEATTFLRHNDEQVCNRGDCQLNGRKIDHSLCLQCWLVQLPSGCSLHLSATLVLLILKLVLLVQVEYDFPRRMSNGKVVQIRQVMENGHVNRASDTIEPMPPEALDRLMAELKVWFKDHHGEQKKLADELHISEQLLSNWLARRKDPGLKNYLLLQEFAEKHRIGPRKK
jgi:DNA-binding transcriptional regulator YiaG